MARPPDKTPLHPFQYHRLSEDHAIWDRYYVHGDPEPLVILLPGPPKGTSAGRAREHRLIFARLEAKRRQYQKYCLGNEAYRLWGARWGQGTKRGNKITFAEIRALVRDKAISPKFKASEYLKKPGDLEISLSETRRVIKEWPKNKGFVTGDSHSIIFTDTNGKPIRSTD